MMTSMRITVVAVVLGVFAAGSAFAADLESGKKKVQEVCAACHNIDGVSTVPDYPKLAGQYPDYLAKALRDYKSGLRKNAIMAAFAQTLTEAEIQNVSAYFAAQPSVLSSRY